MQGITSIASPLGAGYRNTAARNMVVPEPSCTEREQWPDSGKSHRILVHGLLGVLPLRPSTAVYNLSCLAYRA